MKFNVIGNSPSSGSTILSDILDSHEKLLSGPELNLFSSGIIFDYERFKEDPFTTANSSSFYRRRLSINDLRLFSYSLDKNYFSEIVDEHSDLISFLHDLGRFYSIARGKKEAVLFSEKTPENINAIDKYSWNEELQFTTIIRHPIYVFKSLLNRGFSPLAAMMTWYFDVLKYWSHKESPFIHELRYEELVDNPFEYVSQYLKQAFNIEIVPSELKSGLKQNEYRYLHRFGSRKNVLPWSINTSTEVKNGNEAEVSQEILELFYEHVNIRVSKAYAERFGMKVVSLVDLINELDYKIDYKRVSKKKVEPDEQFLKMANDKLDEDIKYEEATWKDRYYYRKCYKSGRFWM